MKSDVMTTTKLEQTAKAWVTVLFAVLTALSGVTLPDPANKIVAVILLVLAPVVVYLTPNAPKEVLTPEAEAAVTQGKTTNSP